MAVHDRGQLRRSERCVAMPIRWLIEEIAGSLRRIRRRGWNALHLVLILALGFGCVIGMFDVAYGVLHAPLPAPNADRIAVAGNPHSRRLLFVSDRPSPHLGTVFEKAAEYKLIDANLELPRQTLRLRVGMVSPEFFSTLGITMAKGRGFSHADFFPEPSSQPRWLPIIVSHDLWRSYFGSSDDILSRSLDLNIEPYRYQVVGIAPPGTSFPAGADAWVPVHLISFSTIQSAGIPFGEGGVIGLLKPGLPIAAAEAMMQRWPKERLFESGREEPVRLIPLREFWAGEIYPLSVKLWLASLFFLALILIAVATIFQTEAEIRRDEFALKGALGASAARQLGSLGVETALVVLLALAASFWVREAVIHVTTAYLVLPPGFDASLRAVDLAMAAAVGSLAFTASLVIQGLQLLHLPSAPSSERLGGQAVKGHRKARGLFRYRIPVQMIPATAIVIVACMFARSAYNTMHIDVGVQTGNVFVSEIGFSTEWIRVLIDLTDPGMSAAERMEASNQSSRRFREMMNSDIQTILDRLTESPGVIHAGVISTAPYRGHRAFAMDAQYSPNPGVPPDSDTIPGVALRAMTPSVMPALGMRLLYGQPFSGQNAEDEGTILVNEALVQKLGEGQHALGRYIKLPVSPPVGRIVGIVGNVREEGLYSQVQPTVYLPLSQYAVASFDLVVRTAPGFSSSDVLQLMQTSARAASNNAAVSNFQQLSTMVESAGTLSRYTGYYLLALAVLSILLAGFCASSKTIGEFHRRREELGIRLALGATRARLVRMFLSADLRRNAVAALAGALLAWWLSHLLGHLLYGVERFDPGSYAIGAAALIGSIAAVQILLLSKALNKNPRDLM